MQIGGGAVKVFICHHMAFFGFYPHEFRVSERARHGTCWNLVKMLRLLDFIQHLLPVFWRLSVTRAWQGCASEQYTEIHMGLSGVEASGLFVPCPLLTGSRILLGWNLGILGSNSFIYQ